MEMEFNESSVIATMNPVLLLAALIAVIVLAWLCARKYRNTNDFRKSSILYGFTGVFACLIFFIAGVPGMLSAGLYICGFVAMALFSNRYFNQ